MNKTRLLKPAHRAVPRFEFRAIDDKEGRFQARVMHYNVIDDYETEFAPGLFEASLRARLPRVVWAHDWAEPLGRYIDYEDTDEHLDLIGEFDNFDDVPRARQAYAQLKSGTIDEFSVGFMPLDGERVTRGGRDIFRFTRARLDEVSLVLAGAVPNTQLLAVRQPEHIVRSPILSVSKDFAAQTILDLAAGKIDIADALQQIKVEAVLEEEGTDELETGDSGDGGDSDADSDSGGDVNSGDLGDGADEGSAEDDTDGLKSVDELLEELSQEEITFDDNEDEKVIEINFSDLDDIDDILAKW